MHPSALLLILVAAGFAAGSGTPAARFWEEALPGTPMPEAIADLVQKGINQSPLKERYSAAYNSLSGAQAYQNYGKFTRGMPPPGFFFHEALVRVDSTITVSFPPATTTAILPRDIVEKVPFGSLEDTLAMFNITPGSAEALDETLRGCRERPLPGEQKACATSLEGTVLTAMRMLGTTRGVWAAASALTRAGLPRQQYVVREVTRLNGDRHVGCHDVTFPYAVFHCHMTAQSTRAYVISLQGLRGGPEVAMAAICHLDTSDWNPAHPAFKMLHSQPGGAPVCHFLPYANLVFGVKAANDDET